MKTEVKATNVQKVYTGVALSTVGKLDGIKSWSLQAMETCPGAIDLEKGGIVDACAGCYARYGNYAYPSVKAPRLHNGEDWKRDSWVSDMVAALDDSRYFRWFDSGDMYALELAEKIFAVMQQTPWVKHWLPTRMNKFAKFADVIQRMQALQNVMVRFSSDSVTGDFIPGVHGSTIAPSAEEMPKGVHVCKAYENKGGKCDSCRACWNKNIPVIGYIAHGVVMKKVIRITKAG